MRNSVERYVSSLSTKKFTNNVQRVLYQLLERNGEWLTLKQVRVSSPDTRIRDLRKGRFGGFNVLCDNGAYRIVVRELTVSQLRNVFKQ